MGLSAGKCTSTARLDGKVAVITGCNTGMGKYTALDFYKRGCRVIMACRDTAKAEIARDDIHESLKNVPDVGSLVIKKLDLASLKSIRAFAEEILKEEKKIHLLVNNAGVMMCPKSSTEDGFEMHFGTNHLGHFLLTVLLLPRLIESGPSRIVNVSSMAHSMGAINFDDLNCEKSYGPFWAYANTKLANILFTKELARRLEGKNVNVYALHPGVVRTDIDRHAKQNYAFPGSIYLYNLIGPWLMKTAEQGAQTTIYCAVDEKTANETGLYYSDCKVVNPSSKAEDMEVAKKLWDVSWILVKLNSYDPFKSKK